ncbi:MAG: RNA polymerase sigma factor [Prevotella sp.]|nr:RNA polymerase sigma factor [Prevotella sp.]
MEKQIFEEIVNEIRPQLFELCERFLIKRKLTVEAEDAVQETLFKLWRMHDQLKAYKSVQALAVAIAKNVCIDILRRQHAQVVPLNDMDIVDRDEADQVAITKDTQTRIREALNQLPHTKRRMIEMRSEGMSLDEISNVCNTTKQSTKTMISSARRMLLEKLRKGEL